MKRAYFMEATGTLAKSHRRIAFRVPSTLSAEGFDRLFRNIEDIEPNIMNPSNMPQETAYNLQSFPLAFSTINRLYNYFEPLMLLAISVSGRTPLVIAREEFEQIIPERKVSAKQLRSKPK